MRTVTGKIVKIHVEDAYYKDRNKLIGKICSIKVKNQRHAFYSGWAEIEGFTGEQETYFYGVKLEPCAPSEEQKCSQ